MTYNVLDVSRYIINRSIDIDEPTSNLKLQKLLYYVQAAFLVEKNRPCFEEEIFSWRHGPVIVEAYDEFKVYQGNQIKDKQTEYSELKLEKNLEVTFGKKEFKDEDIQKEDRDIINKVVESYKNFDAWEMVEKTHNEAPWKQTNRNEVIDLDTMKEYYKESGSVYGRK